MGLILIGAGSNAGPVIEVIEENNNLSIIGLSDIESNLGQKILSYNVHFTDDKLEEHLLSNKSDRVFITYAENSIIKKKLYQRFETFIYEQPIISVFSHPSKYANIGKGTIIMPGAMIRNGAKIGRNCLINTGAIIEHDVQIGNHCHISPGAVITGNVTIGECTQIGANATVLPRISIGNMVIVGAGTLINKNIPKNKIVYGVPGALKGENTET
jgi:UDP-perosamine 4-acetyltransferase